MEIPRIRDCRISYQKYCRDCQNAGLETSQRFLPYRKELVTLKRESVQAYSPKIGGKGIDVGLPALLLHISKIQGKIKSR